jgi:hypothetical protein
MATPSYWAIENLGTEAGMLTILVRATANSGYACLGDIRLWSECSGLEFKLEKVLKIFFSSNKSPFDYDPRD